MNTFDKVRHYPALALGILIGSIALGILLTFLLKNPLILLPSAFIGGVFYYKLATRYKCPRCEAHLWYVKDKKNMKNCPKCGADLG
ncbi:hypothetical protein ACTQ46_09085 [Gallicola sp. Sow4_E12]|uniref:hypothetical protein n=1 Tax=Gallicola sp. Sow4_E12 TaxID=3438785 RepID=UPI003F909AD4